MIKKPKRIIERSWYPRFNAQTRMATVYDLSQLILANGEADC